MNDLEEVTAVVLAIWIGLTVGGLMTGDQTYLVATWGGSNGTSEHVEATNFEGIAFIENATVVSATTSHQMKVVSVKITPDNGSKLDESRCTTYLTLMNRNDSSADLTLHIDLTFESPVTYSANEPNEPIASLYRIIPWYIPVIAYGLIMISIILIIYNVYATLTEKDR